MASAVIHIAVANEINKKINRDPSRLLLGSIAPDIAKLIGETKIKSHFITDSSGMPNMEEFLKKYQKHLSDDFVMGYFIHLYTDYLWGKYFISEIKEKHMIRTIEGEYVKCDAELFQNYIYNDYTNLNIRLIDEYNLDLKILYNDIPDIKNIITEIPMDRLKVLTNKVGEIIANTKEYKTLVFDLENINNFIEMSTDLTLAKINEIEK